MSVKVLTASTREADYPDSALAELLAQINLDDLAQNSLGIVTCGHEFVVSGTVAALSESLPFTIVGCTSLGSATGGDSGMDILVLTVLTGDDISFSVAISDTLRATDYTGGMTACCLEAVSRLAVEPRMALIFLPLQLEISTTKLLRSIDTALGDIPVFGTVSCNNTADIHEDKYVFLNKALGKEKAVVVLLAGEVKANFLVFDSSGYFEGIRNQHGIISEVDGCILKKVNGITFLDYLTSIKIDLRDLVHKRALPTPFVITGPDGEKRTRTIKELTPEGYAIFSDDLPHNGSLSVKSLNYKGVLASATHMAETLAQKDRGGALVFLCVLRCVSLGLKSGEEFTKIMSILGTSSAYHIAASGGEICPHINNCGKTTNAYNNYSIVCCYFT
jgi:hypothetical protein